MPNPLQAVSIGIIILFLIVSVPTVLDSSQGTTQQTIELEEGETQRLSDRLEITNERVRPPSPENATFTVKDTDTLDSQTEVIANGSQATFELSGGNVTVAVKNVIDASPERVRVTVQSPTTYGYSDGSQTIVNNLGLVLVAVAFIVILGLVGSVIN